MQNIQLYKIKQALQLFKYVLQNPFYKDVLINKKWEETNERQHSELWASLTAILDADKDTTEEEGPCEAEAIHDDQEDLNVVEEDKTICSASHQGKENGFSHLKLMKMARS